MYMHKSEATNKHPETPRKCKITTKRKKKRQKDKPNRR